MKILHLLLTASAIGGLFLFKQTKPWQLQAMLIVLVLFILGGFSQNVAIVDLCFVLFGVAGLLFSILHFSAKKWLHVIIGLFPFLYVLVDLFLYSYSGSFKFIMIIPLVAMAFILKDWKTHLSELSLLIIFSVFSLNMLLFN